MMVSKYKQLKQHIQSKILDGSFRPHQKILSEYEYVKNFEVSRHTVRQAIGELVSEGWLYREHGVGTFCADRSKFSSPSTRKNVAIITTYISDYIFPYIIRGAERYLSDKGYNVILMSTNNDFDKEKQALENILTQQVDGLIIEPTRSAQANPNLNYYLNLENAGIPYVMMNAYYEELEPLSLTLNDQEAGFRNAEHLIQLGHRRIIGLFKTDDMQGVQRMKGFLKAHRHYGCPVDPSLLITYSTDEKYSKAAQSVEQILRDQTDGPTGLVTYNDELLLQLLDVLRDKNLQVPEDISVVSFDDSHFTQISEVKFSSIVHPKERMGEDAAKYVTTLIEQPGAALSSIVYEPHFVDRHSTRSLQFTPALETE
ncbi:GntR family transcriptional regulator [Marinococcus luteus]